MTTTATSVTQHTQWPPALTDADRTTLFRSIGGLSTIAGPWTWSADDVSWYSNRPTGLGNTQAMTKLSLGEQFYELGFKDETQLPVSLGWLRKALDFIKSGNLPPTLGVYRNGWTDTAWNLQQPAAPRQPPSDSNGGWYSMGI